MFRKKKKTYPVKPLAETNAILSGYRQYGYFGDDEVAGIPGEHLFPWRRPTYRYVRIDPLHWKPHADRLVVWGRVWLRHVAGVGPEVHCDFAHLWYYEDGALAVRHMWLRRPCVTMEG